MANPIWSLSNQKIDNRGTKVNPALTTVTPSNTGGWETLVTYSNGTTFQYRIDEKGNVGYREGESGRQYANLQQYADALAGENSTEFIQNFINRRKSDITEVLKTRTQNTIPSQPAPTTPTGQTPAAAASGPNSGIGTQFTGVGIEPLPEGTFDSGNVGKKFTYPSTLNSGQDRVFITQFKYRRSGAIQTEFDFRQTGEGAVTQPLGYVTLPMPNDLSEANSVGWGEDSLSNAAALMMGPLSQGVVGMAEGNMGQLTNAGELLGGVLNRGDVSARIKQVLTANAAASVVKKFGINVNPEAYISRITSAAVNPNLELLFNGPKLRQFSLAYKMVARSQAEAEQIRGILRFFKKGMAPQRSQSTSFYLGTPNVFRVEFKSGNTTLKSIGQFKTCALVAFSANYTPDGFYAAYDDSKAGGSQPIAVTMQMGFTELTPVFNDEFNDNDLGDVGPNKFDVDFNKLDLNSPSPASRGPVQGPTPDGRTLEEVRRQQLTNQGIQSVLQSAAAPLPGGG